jgi:hypothetical protein
VLPVCTIASCLSLCKIGLEILQAKRKLIVVDALGAGRRGTAHRRGT